MTDGVICNEYKHNPKFRDYVDEYSKHHEISVEEALKHKEVRRVYLYLTEV